MSTMPPRRPHPDPGLSPSEWHTQELLLMREVMRGIGRSLAPALVLREMLHLMSELLGLNRGRIVLADPAPGHKSQPPTACIQHAYGLTQAEVARGRYAWGEGITGRVLATGQPAIVQDIDAEPLFLFRAVERSHLPPVTVAFIALPIEVNNVPIGVLACHRIRSRQRHLNDDLAVLRAMATLSGQLLQLEELVAEQTRRLEARNAVLAQALNTNSARYGLIGNSPPLLQALNELEQVSQTAATVLLLGESGTGKELFARAVHLASPRRDQPFIKVNCSAIPDALFESELFGYERGAFTGAGSARAGWFEQAHGGTIFLDEIGELPLAMQSKLLRTLQEGTLVRLGGQTGSARERARGGRHQPRSGARSGHRPLPPGPFLPAQRDPDPAAVAARASRGHPRAGAALREPRQPGAPAQRQPGQRRPWRAWKTMPGPATSANSAT
jgi:Nif-specific regulatory protein